MFGLLYGNDLVHGVLAAAKLLQGKARVPGGPGSTPISPTRYPGGALELMALPVQDWRDLLVFHASQLQWSTVHRGFDLVAVRNILKRNLQ